MTRMDRTTAQSVATRIISDALSRFANDPGGVCEHGDDYRIADRAVRVHRVGDSIDGLISFTIEDDTRGASVAVNIMVAAEPLGGAA